jgi:uncharacterized protein
MIFRSVNSRATGIHVRGEWNIQHTDHLPGLIPLGIFVARFSLNRGGTLSLAVALIFSACSVLAPHEDRTHFIILSPVTSSSTNGLQPAEGQKLASATIGLGPVQFAQYLDRPELVIRTSPNGFELSETDRWAEPLGDNFRHVIANDLTNLLGTTNIAQYPWYPGTRFDYIVHIQVQRFEVDTAQKAHLIARWELINPQTDQILTTREAQLSHPTASAAGDAAAAALSDEVAELAGQIASAITQIEQQRLARGPR